jgi:quercetin dioxygenase-like cupin family protein
LREELSTHDLEVFGQTGSVSAVASAPGEALSPQDCAALARRAALEESAVRSATGETESVVLWEDEDSIAWLNVARDPRDTGFHDHDGSAVGVYVIAGSVTNEGLPAGGTRRVRRYRPGDSFWVPASGIHRMSHDLGAITVHVYSPPLRAIGYYEVVDGLLQRTLGPPDEPSPESPRLLAALPCDVPATSAESLSRLDRAGSGVTASA